MKYSIILVTSIYSGSIVKGKENVKCQKKSLERETFRYSNIFLITFKTILIIYVNILFLFISMSKY